jgi:hypothetical protein
MGGRRKPLRHVLDVYGYPIHLATDARQWRKIREEITTLPEDPDSHGATHSVLEVTDAGPNLLHLVFYVDVAGHDPETPGELVQTCAHEAAHGAGFLFDHIGAPYDGRTEPYAYLVGWLTLWIWQGCERARHDHV